jgi:hypothetical protein
LHSRHFCFLFVCRRRQSRVAVGRVVNSCVIGIVVVVVNIIVVVVVIVGNVVGGVVGVAKDATGVFRVRVRTKNGIKNSLQGNKYKN